MIYYLILSIIVSFSIVFQLKNRFIQVPIVQEIWSWDKRNGLSETIEDPRENKKDKNSSPYKNLNGYLTQNKKPFLIKSKTIFQGEEGDLFEVPPLGNGFLAYKKIGEKITYYSKNGEVLWKKSFQSIPFSSFTGSLHFMVSGDGNQVLIVDMDGNKTGAKQLDGRFLTDISTTTLSGSLILFSGGEVYRLDKSGNLLYSYKDANSKIFSFYKSSGLSENGKFVSLHYMESDFDYIKTIDETKKEILKIKLDSVYPHKIYMAVSNQGNTLLNLRDKIVIYSNSGNLLKEFQKEKKEDVYQVAFFTNSIFCINKSDELIFLTEYGEIIKRKKILSNQFRLFPSKVENYFFMENNSSIIQFRIF